MKQYIINTVTELDWDKAETAKIDTFKWFTDYKPETYCKLLALKDKGIAAKYFCHEKNPKAVYTKFYEDVYKDSCMEFFFAFKKGGKYVNCEMNSNGAALIGVGEERNNRVRLDKITNPPEVKAAVYENYWTVEVFFDIPTLQAIFGDISLEKGTVLYGNFYKCGDKTQHEHYGMWSEVGTDSPNFHCPEFFGELIIK